MRSVYIQLAGTLSIVLGSYLLLGLADPRMRHWSCRNDPAGVVGCAAAFAILFGLYGLGVGGLYTLVGATVVLAVGLAMALVNAMRDREMTTSLNSIAKHRQFIIGFVLLDLILVGLCLLL